MTCPGCNGPISRRAQLCGTCRRRAIAVGVEQIIAPPADPRSSRQNAAFHGKCSTLAELELGKSADRADLSRRAREHKHAALAYASAAFHRTIESSKDLSYDEMSEILDWLDSNIESESTAL